MQSYLTKSSFVAAALTLAAASGCQKSEKTTAEKVAPSVLDAGKLGQPEEKEEAASIPEGMLGGFKPALLAVYESEANPLTDEKVNLGRKLYFDKRLSKNHDVSCNSCHALDKYGVDGQKTSTGHKGQLGNRNSPTVYNAAGHFVQFWDGRSPDVENQATGPILNPVEMALPNEAAVKKTLGSIPEYVAEFKKAFPEEAEAITLVNVGRAIAAFERKLSTPAPWDEFLSGKEDALTDEQKKGFLTFMNSGCAGCHMGSLVGGTTFQKVGAVKPWPNQADKGRFEVTQNKTDEMMFKAPSLRNIVKTGPYFHDGSVAELKVAIKMMGEHQLGRELSETEVSSIGAWLESLTGALPTDYIKEPELPKSTPKTPKPSPT